MNIIELRRHSRINNRRIKVFVTFSGQFRNFNHSLLSNFLAFKSPEVQLKLYGTFWARNNSEEDLITEAVTRIGASFFSSESIHLNFKYPQDLSSVNLRIRNKHFSNPSTLLPMFLSRILLAEQINKALMKGEDHPDILIYSRTDLGFTKSLRKH